MYNYDPVIISEKPEIKFKAVQQMILLPQGKEHLKNIEIQYGHDVHVHDDGT